MPVFQEVTIFLSNPLFHTAKLSVQVIWCFTGTQQDISLFIDARQLQQTWHLMMMMMRRRREEEEEDHEDWGWQQCSYSFSVLLHTEHSKLSLCAVNCKCFTHNFVWTNCKHFIQWCSWCYLRSIPLHHSLCHANSKLLEIEFFVSVFSSKISSLSFVFLFKSNLSS